MSRRVKEIRQRFDEVSMDALKFNFLERGLFNTQAESSKREMTTSFVLQSKIIGREEHKNEVIELLLQPHDRENISVVAIVGFGGLGKTTLTQLVYNDERVKNSFDKTFWVCVSREFDVQATVKKMLASIIQKEVDSSDSEELHSQLLKNLQGKRFLLVLDDLWNENDRDWSNLKTFLLAGAQGSRILVTTRTTRVAVVMGVHNPYMLKGLSEDESWALFCKVAFRGEECLYRSSLEEIGREILKRCKGAPLAIWTLARLMQSDLRESRWLAFQHLEMWRLPQHDGDIIPELKLSYDCLPNHLRQCFAFCSIFPKGSRISRETLIRLWYAHGYIQSPLELRDPEDVGEFEHLGDQYFDDLLTRLFFQDVEEDEFENVKSCKMHDLIHDLAQSVAGYSCYTVTVNTKVFPEGVHHVSFEHNLQHFKDVMGALVQVKAVRTIFFNSWLPEEKPYLDMIISKFESLRALNLSNLNLKGLPSSIGRLMHLRYLDVSGNNEMKSLPNSISNLCNLQTLVLSECGLLKGLPTDIRKLINLRYLLNDGCWSLTHMPTGLGELTSLRKLSVFVVSANQSLSSGSAMLNELNRLNHLSGEICLTKLENVRNAAKESSKANLKEKKNVELLRLEWSCTTSCPESKELLDSLQPHPNIKKIEVIGYGGSMFPAWVSSLTGILGIYLQNCNKCRHLPPLDQLPRLETLHLDELVDLEGIYLSESVAKANPPVTPGWATTFFPSLKILKIMGCRNLKGWQGADGPAGSSSEASTVELPPFACLSELVVTDCPNLRQMPISPNIKKKYVDSLWLEWNSTTDSLEGKEPLDSLLRNPNLKKIQVIGFRGLRWISSLTGIVSIYLQNCNKCRHLPPLDQLPRLETLHLDELVDLEGIYLSESVAKANPPVTPGWATTFFPSLKILKIMGCRNLKGWQGADGPAGSSSEASTVEFPPFACLSELVVTDCPNLRQMPISPNIKKKYVDSLRLEWNSTTGSLEGKEPLDSLLLNPDLKKIEVISFGSFLDWLSSLTGIVSIYLQNCNGCGHLPSLDQLPCLEALHLDHLVALESIYLSRSVAETDSPTGPLFPSLKILKLRGCPRLIGWQWQRDQMFFESADHLPPFPCLSELVVENCPNLISMPAFPTVETDLRLSNMSPEPLWRTLATEVVCVSCSYVCFPLSKLKSLVLNRVLYGSSLPKYILDKLESLEFLEIVPRRRILVDECEMAKAQMAEADDYDDWTLLKETCSMVYVPCSDKHKTDRGKSGKGKNFGKQMKIKKFWEA